MANDQMQDVNPINFDFKKGEQPSATKFTGWAKQTDAAFSRVVNAIGDPWEYQSHTAGASASRVNLSPERLAQTSLARIIGPSDWASPQGSSWNESGSVVLADLAGDRNTWSLGYPLVKVSSSLTPTATISSNITPLVWATDIVVTTDPSSVFVTEKTSLAAVINPGDFYVDYYGGVITTYKICGSVAARLTISNLYAFGPGVPWGTANIIPTWNQSTVCYVTEDVGSPSGGYQNFTVALPTVEEGTRSTGTVAGAQKPYVSGSATAEVSYQHKCPGAGASYRLPYALTSVFIANDTIPGGYIYIWDEATGRILPNVTFKYINATSVRIQTPEGLGPAEGHTVRIIVTGTSVNEAIGYLMSAARDNRHVGLSNGQDGKTLSFTNRISHDHLTELHSGYIDESDSDSAKYRFTKSNMHINPHPQYLHRAGYNSSDENGNSANAMRGHVVFTGTQSGYPVGGSGTDGNLHSTFGILWGGGTTGSTGNHSSLIFEGGEQVSWTSGSANKIGFGINETGASIFAGEPYGALTYTPWQGTPLYLRGNPNTGSYNYDGAYLGFDLGRRSEMNYVKLMGAARSGASDYPHLPANTGQTSWGIPPHQMPGLSNRISSLQVREFRFRGVPYLSSATNTDDSLGGANTQGVGNEIPEFQKYYTSPAVVGADFLNVYSNAIFFSEDGDGQGTSFTTYGENWLNSGGTKPIGLYYRPSVSAGTEGGRFEFWTAPDPNPSTIRELALYVGSDTQSGISTKSFDFVCSSYFNISCTYAYLYPTSDFVVGAGDDISLTAGDDIGLTATDDFTLLAGGSAVIWTNAGPSAIWAKTGLHLGSNALSWPSTATAAVCIHASNIVPSAPAAGDIVLNAGNNIYTLCGATTQMQATRLDIDTVQDIDLYAGTDIGITAADQLTLRSTNGLTIQSTTSNLPISAGTNIVLSANTSISTAATTYSSITSIQRMAIGSNVSSWPSGGTSVAGVAIGAGTVPAGAWTGFGAGDVHIGAQNAIRMEAGSDVWITGLPNGGTDPIYNTGGKLYTNPSSRRFKKDIVVLDDINWLYNLTPVKFRYKDNDETLHYGLIAEDVLNVNRDLISWDAKNKPNSVIYQSLHAAYIQAHKDTKDKLKVLEAEIISLKQELDKKANKRGAKKSK